MALEPAPAEVLRLATDWFYLGEVPPRYSVTSEPSGFADGDLAWTVDFPTIDMLHDGVLDGRHTLVMRRVEGTWKVVHSHVSEGVERVL